MANYLGVSKRTIKKDLSRIMDLINDGTTYLKSSTSTGYTLDKNFYFNKDKLFLSRDKDLILNNYDRIAYLIQRLLLSKKAVRYEKLADELYISYSSLKKDMRKVRSLLAEYNLKIIHTPSHGVEIAGDEYHIRLAISNFFFHSFLSYLSNYNQNKYIRDSTLIKDLERIIKKAFIKENVILSDNTISDLAIQLFIIFSRIEFEDKLSNREIYIKDVNIKNYEICKQLICSVKNLFHVNNIGEKSINYFYTHFATKKIITYLEEPTKRKMDKFVFLILEEVYQNFDIDLAQNKEFTESLALHFMQLKRRLDADLSINNPLVFQYFRDYLFAAKIAITAVKILETIMTKKTIPIDEYGYLILYFQYAINFISFRNRIYLYTGNNRSEKLMYKQFLDRNLDKKRNEVFYITNLENVDPYFDALISTVNIDAERFKDKNVIIVNDKEKLKHVPTLVNNNNLMLDILKKYISEKSILVSEASNKRQVSKELFLHLRNNGFLKEKCTENFSFQEVGNSLVHIQDLDKNIKKEICLVVLLKKPILWEKTVIKTLFLIKTKKDGDKDLNLLCETFSTWANSPDSIQALHDSPEYSTLLSLLINDDK